MGDDPFTMVMGGWFRCTPAWDQEVWEPHDKWYFPSSGEAFYDAGDGEFRLAPGRIWLIPGRRRHVMRCPRRLDQRPPGSWRGYRLFLLTRDLPRFAGAWRRAATRDVP